MFLIFFFQAEDGIRDFCLSRGLGDVYKRQVLADDSGLEIDYLNKEPGVYSARYMGENTDYHIKNANLIQRLDGVPDEQRTARFVCAIAAAFPDGRVETVRGTMAVSYTHLRAHETGRNLVCRLLLEKKKKKKKEAYW